VGSFPILFGTWLPVHCGINRQGTQILVERSAPGNVEGLDAPADSEDGYLGSEGRTREEEFGGVPLRVNLDARVGPDDFAIVPRIDVRSSAEQQSIQLA